MSSDIPSCPTKRAEFELRFWAKVERSEGCWLWTAATDRNGYGVFSVRRSVARRAHRVAYQLEVGPIPDGLTLDHLCGTRHCVRPDHLEPATFAANARRANTNVTKTHCPKGHPYDESNTYVHPRTGHRLCRTCHRDDMRRRRRSQ